MGLKLHDIYLTGEEKPQKNLTQKTCPDWGSNLGPLRDSAHTTCSTAVDEIRFIHILISRVKVCGTPATAYPVAVSENTVPAETNNCTVQYYNYI